MSLEGLRIVANYESHKYCSITGYCEHCGAHQDTVALENTQCLPVGVRNVIAISHRRAQRILAERVMQDMGAPSS